MSDNQTEVPPGNYLWMGGIMDNEAVIRLNIKHFRRLIATERDEAKRKMLRQLFVEEQEKFAEALRRKLAKE